MKILSIDAWAGEERGCWQWNNWFTVGTITKEEFEKLKTDKDFRLWFKRNGFTITADKKRVSIDDDGYNVTICGKREYDRPIYAIEYGPEY